MKARRSSRRSRRGATVDIAVGTVFEARVRDLAADGRGVVQHESGQVFFVPGVWQGEQVEVKVAGFKGRFGFADCVQIREAAPERRQSPCPHQGFDVRSCGGCPWQFVTYDAQLAAKQKRVQQALEQIAPGEIIRPIAPAPVEFGWRNRAQLKSDGHRLGYLAASSRQLVDIEQCPILTEHNQRTLTQLRESLPRPEWRPVRRQLFSTVNIDESVDADTALINQRLPFAQGNSRQNRYMRAWLLEKLRDQDEEAPVLELFAGSGNFTRIVADAGLTDITAVEGAAEAMADLREQLPQVETLVCDLFSGTAVARLDAALNRCQVLVLDPPRDGFKNDALKSRDGLFRKRSRLRDVFYISCNLATFTRDLQAFTDNGFALREVQPVDQFPHTPHIEILAHLQKTRSQKN